MEAKLDETEPRMAASDDGSSQVLSLLILRGPKLSTPSTIAASPGACLRERDTGRPRNMLGIRSCLRGRDVSVWKSDCHFRARNGMLVL